MAIQHKTQIKERVQVYQSLEFRYAALGRRNLDRKRAGKRGDGDQMCFATRDAVSNGRDHLDDCNTTKSNSVISQRKPEHIMTRTHSKFPQQILAKLKQQHAQID
jgi:hypothetical protein